MSRPFLHRPPPRGRAQRGMSMIELLIAAAIASIALLAHAAGTFSSHRLTKAEESRSIALQAVREFVERMRADQDWSGIYVRYRALYDNAVAKDVRYSPTTYYPDFTVGQSLRDVDVLVQVPHAPSAGGGSDVLREDADEPAFGLPYDLNGDGTIDSNAHDTDYLALPVIISFRWTPAGEARQEIRMVTWMGGNE